MGQQKANKYCWPKNIKKTNGIFVFIFFLISKKKTANKNREGQHWRVPSGRRPTFWFLKCLYNNGIYFRYKNTYTIYKNIFLQFFFMGLIF